MDTTKKAHKPEDIHLLGSDMLRGSGQRVVSAWRHMREAMTPGRWLKATMHERLFDLIRSDVLSFAAGDHGGQTDIADRVCRPYINLAKSYGEERWPLEALREYFRERGEPEAMAEQVWKGALVAYWNVKEFVSGRPPR